MPGGAPFGLRRHPLLLVLGVQAGGADEPGGTQRGQLQELAAVDGALRRERLGIGAAVRWEGLHVTEFTHAPPLQIGEGR